MKLIKYISLATVVLASCGDAPEAIRTGIEKEPAVNIEHKDGMNVVGRVTVDGKAREGIVVSDGINVIATDANGEYQMRSVGRQHIFVSVPEDCQIPVENGAPKIYKSLQFNEDAVIQVNFDLKSRVKPESFKLYAVADVQIGYESDVTDWQANILPDMIDLASGLGNDAYGISLGDIIWNAPDMYPTYVQTITKVPVPMFSVIGNHDHNEKTKGDTESDKEFRDALGPTYYSCNIGDWHLVVLDDVIYSGASGRNDYTCAVNQQQLDWLAKDLQYVDHSKSILIGVHVPTATLTTNSNLTNTADLHNLVKDYAEVQILSGHTHQNFQTIISDNMEETTLGAMMGAYWNTKDGVGVCSDGSPRGYAVLEFTGNHLTNKYYKGAAHPADYQIKIYKPEEASYRFGKDDDGNPVKVDNENILVNIFFWREDWKVELQEDGGAWQTITNFANASDPLAVQILQGDNPWEVRPSAGPSSPKHMFTYKPAASWKTITVKATDPYGNVYQSTANR